MTCWVSDVMAMARDTYRIVGAQPAVYRTDIERARLNAERVSEEQDVPRRGIISDPSVGTRLNTAA